VFDGTVPTRAAPPNEVDGDTGEHQQEADPRGRGREVGKVEDQQSRQGDVDEGSDRIADGAIRPLGCILYPVADCPKTLAMLPLLVALAWYVSHPAHRRGLYVATPRPDVRVPNDRKLKHAA
jgi:hypothetical protein